MVFKVGIRKEKAGKVGNSWTHSIYRKTITFITTIVINNNLSNGVVGKFLKNRLFHLYLHKKVLTSTA